MKKKAYKFTIPVSWNVSSEIEIEATSLDGALEQALYCDLPEESNYIDGSFEVNTDCVEEMNLETLEMMKIDETPYENLPLLIDTLTTEKGKERLNKYLKEGK